MFPADHGRREKGCAALWWLGAVLAALAWTSCAPARAQNGDDLVTLTLTVETASFADYSRAPDNGLDEDGFVVRMGHPGVEHRRETRVGPFSLSVRLTLRPDTRAPVPACMDKLDRALAESREPIEHNEAALQATRESFDTLDSAIEEGLRTGVIEAGPLKIHIGAVDPDHAEFLKQQFRDSLGKSLRQSVESLTRLLDEQYGAHARRVEVRNAAVPLCQAIDLLRQIEPRQYELTDDGIRTASATFAGGHWSAEEERFSDDGLVRRYRLGASSEPWNRPSGAVEWAFVSDAPLSAAKDYVVMVLRLAPSRQEQLRGIFAALGERVEEARALDAAWGGPGAVRSPSFLEYDLREAAGSALRALWEFGLEPPPRIPSLLGEVGGEVVPVTVPELEGDTVIRLERFPAFARSFPVDVVGDASVEQFGNSEVVVYWDGDAKVTETRQATGPTRRAAAVRLRLGEDPSEDIVRWVLSDLRLRLAFDLSPDPALSPPAMSVRALPGPDAFVSDRTRDWARHAVVAHGSGTVRGTLLKSWQESRHHRQVRHEVRYGWTVSVGGSTVADTDPVEPQPEEEIELRVVAADGRGFRPLDGPLPFGRPFFIEGVLGEDSDRRSLMVTLGAGAGEGRDVVLTRSAEDPRLLRSEMLYLMWESEGVAGADD